MNLAPTTLRKSRYLKRSSFAHCFLRAAIVAILSVLCFPHGYAEAVNENRAARDLIERVAPREAKHFIVETIAADQGRDVFEIESRGADIVLRGNSGVAIGAGLNWYLKYYCQCHYSLKARQMDLPRPLPRVPAKVRQVSQEQWRYFLNYCCFGYSLPWYGWEQWERLIDWMALNGINAPLAVTGQEAVWSAAGQRLGLTEGEMEEFLAGPPYLPFGWMGCLDGWGGPLPKSWAARRVELQQRILARQRALGMTPVLQGFTGHVPAAAGKRFPDARLHKVRWAEWETSMLDPLDPLFARFARAFLEEQQRLFGTDHLYAADTFIEMTPPSGETNFLAATGRAIYEGMAQVDPKAAWVLQGWTFYNQAQFWTQPRIEAFLDAVPNEHMLVLDLFCDVTAVWNKTKAFCGKPWVWCALQNFGDCVYLGGGLSKIHEDLAAARLDPLAARRAGVGFVNEGLDYNPIIFDFLFEQAWRSEPVNLTEWVDAFAQRTQGGTNAEAAQAWAILKNTVYTGQFQVAPAYTLVPSLGWAGEPPYDSARLAQAWELLIEASRNRKVTDSAAYHLVAVTRQVLGNYSAEFHRQVLSAWRAKDAARLQSASDKMKELICDLDELLGSRPEYLLGNWLKDARGWGKTKAERDRMEWNARRVITMWGDQTLIRDYSRRDWSGMLTGFYLKRWEKFYAALQASLATGKDFDAAAFDRELQEWERQWANAHERYPTQIRGNSVKLARQLWEKYGPELRKSVEPDAPSLTTGRPAKCSSALPGYPPELACDGRTRSTDRYWATDIKQDPFPWWQVDLGAPTKVGRVVVVAYFGDERSYGFTVEGSNDEAAWQTLAEQRVGEALSIPDGYACRFAPREVRFLRVRETANSANTGRHLVEVSAFAE